MTFDELIELAREESNEVQRDKGTSFEKIVKIYLTNEPVYKNLYSDVWLLNEVPEEYGISKKDTGVDLVAKNEATGELTAIQAKFYDNKIYKRHIDSFLAELGKNYYSDGMIVYSVDSLSINADEAINGLSKSVAQISISDLRNSRIKWDSFVNIDLETVKIKKEREEREYQNEAIALTMNHFVDNDRGQLIMAPGTGKTYTSLKLVEKMASEHYTKPFVVLYLVPSIQLLSQTLISWNNDTDLTIHSFAITSDRNASKKKDENDFLAKDIGFPATTDAKKLIENYSKIKHNPRDLIVIFSTYQSISVLNEAQNQGFPEFDIIICDEAHRTTGAKALGDEASLFTRVHDNSYIKSKKRLYQTATPKIYGNDAKLKADDSSIVLSSMDDEKLYGKEIYRLGFGKAVLNNILTDYKVMVLAVDETMIQKDMQRILDNKENGLDIDDVSKLVGVWNGLMKRTKADKENQFEGKPMKRAISFINTIENSKKISAEFNEVVNEYLDGTESINQSINVRHVDGLMNTLQKKEALDWLSEDFSDDETRVLSNVKFLTEGIDVPNLDAVIFLAPKKSQVDIVQAVGRIMRQFEGKEYGYIILPIVIPSGTTAETVLDNNKQYEAVWQILNALRSVDERFSAMINKLELNKKKPEGDNNRLTFKGIDSAPSDEDINNSIEEKNNSKPVQTFLDLDWEEVENAIYAKVVKKVGDRRYLEDWSEDVEKIAQRHITQINLMIEEPDSEVRAYFNEFLNSLKHNINDSIDDVQAIEMLAQHLITAPIFETLFESYSFVNNNPVSESMNKIISKLTEFGGFSKEQEELEEFYDSVRLRAEGIDNAEAKQKIIITLYDKFFSKGFKETTQRLGIVFTPVEVVDFIIKSVDEVLVEYFGKNIEDEDVHILDPFTGTGTFIVRTLHYLNEKLSEGTITLADITTKYTQGLHANEIVLLSYYIAAINIESTFAEINNQNYQPFEGIILTDTFETTEQEDTLDDVFFGQNDERLKRQKEIPLTAIIGNPPYSAGQKSDNDNSVNQSYPKLERAISNTYAKYTDSKMKKTLYDSYIEAFRWASDRLGSKGVIGFVSNGSYIDSQATDGLRKCLFEEYNYLYIFNLRGDARTQGEQRRKESGNVFDSGTRTPITISILVRDGSSNHKLFYKDIGDYLTTEQKLNYLKDTESLKGIDWENIIPDENNDWINKRDKDYEGYTLLKDKNEGIYREHLIGVTTGRDFWVYGFNKTTVSNNVKKLINNYNNELNRLGDRTDRSKLVNNDPSFVSWGRSLRKRIDKGEKLLAEPENIILSMYRPFTKKHLFYQSEIIENPGSFKKIYPNMGRILYIQGTGEKSGFSSILTEHIPNFHLISSGKALPEYFGEDSLGSIDNINHKSLGLNSEETLYYVYGLLHNKEYLEKYENDLKKGFPRIPKVENMDVFIEIGKSLANLHLNYENLPILDGVEVKKKSKTPNYKVKKMKHPKKGKLDTIVYNEDIKIINIPERAYEYVVSGKPAIEWIIDQYKVKEDKKSGHIDDPNDYSDNPEYILNLLLSIINLSMQTLDLVESLPRLKVIE